MPKSINLGNGSILVGLDSFGQVKDFYYHYPGLENHTEHLTHKIGVYIEDNFSWLDNPSWKVVVRAADGTMASDITATNDSLGVEIKFTDVVHNEKDIFLRKIVVANKFDRARRLKIFFNQEFNISQTHTGETAYYDPREKVLIHYKGRRVFLINASCDNREFSEYSVGLLGIEGKDGTFKDAEDGYLSGNAIEHGQVDSVIAVGLDIPIKSSKTVYYWVCVAKSIQKAKVLHEFVLAKSADRILNSSQNYWRAWVNVQNFSFWGLSKEIMETFKKSLLYMRSHVANNGAIIASGDSAMLQFGRDYYEYVWPRDASYAAGALANAGDFRGARKFFNFCQDIITEEGYFMHKYRPDKSLGSSWHPWVRDGQKQFPIQEDETAIVVVALWKYYELSRDLEFIESLYNPLIEKAANFMVSYRDGKTGLPKASYDLWERIYGITTYSSCCVFAALAAASRFAGLLGKSESEKIYFDAASDIKKGILKYLYNKNEGYFYKLIDTERENGIDKTIDISSVYGVFAFEVLPSSDERVRRAIDKTLERLTLTTQTGGIARFEGDSYHHKGGNYPGNSWIVTTLWIAQYYIKLAKNEKDLEVVKNWLEWATALANPAGILPEQIDPYSGEHLSASPLVWSHAEFVTTVVEYLKKLEEMGVCKACYPLDKK